MRSDTHYTKKFTDYSLKIKLLDKFTVKKVIENFLVQLDTVVTHKKVDASAEDTTKKTKKLNYRALFRKNYPGLNSLDVTLANLHQGGSTKTVTFMLHERVDDIVCDDAIQAWNINFDESSAIEPPNRLHEILSFLGSDHIVNRFQADVTNSSCKFH